jgi:rubrerythrin
MAENGPIHPLDMGVTAMNLLDNKGVSLENQSFTWKEMVGKPISKLDDDAFTRVRIILMNGLELDALRLGHLGAQFNGDLRQSLARIRRIEHHQATMVNWLLSADHSPLETTIAYEQVAIEVTAEVAQNEPDPYLAQVYRFGLLEDFDHLYRYSALLDRTEGKDANNILQGYTDIVPGRPTAEEHRAPVDDLRTPYGPDADLISKLHATVISASEHQTHDYYMNIGPTFADPIARQLYAEIASIEEQHVTQYRSLINPQQSFIEQWLIHEAAEVYAYNSCAESESNPRIRAIWERFVDYELGHLHHVCGLLESIEGRDRAEILSQALPTPLQFKSQRDFVRNVLEEEVDLRTNGTQFVDPEQESEASLDYRQQINADGSPSTLVAEGYRWTAGTELSRPFPKAA